MTFFLSPFSFLFISIYFFLLSSFLIRRSFLILWVLIEFLILVFIGISYSFVIYRFSSLIIFFVIQASSSLILLASFTLKCSFLFSLSLLLKLGIFPFFAWFLVSVTPFPSFILVLTSTTQKLPPFLVLFLFQEITNSFIFWVSSLVGLVLFPIFILSLSDCRVFLILSSICNNSWLFLRQLFSLALLLVFLLIYFFNFILLLCFFSRSLSLGVYPPNKNPLGFFLSLISLSGLPPFPIFFIKLFCVLFIKFSLSEHSNLCFFILFANSFLVLAYIKFIFKFITTSFYFNPFFID